MLLLTYKSFVRIKVLLCIFFGLYACHKEEDDFAKLDIEVFQERQEDFSIWQLAQFNYEVQMCYIIKTDDNKIIVVDGGMPDSYEHVSGYLKQLGGRVHTWITTHPHIDHISVLNKALESDDIKIDKILHSKLDENWVFEHEKVSASLVSEYYRNLEASDVAIIDVKKEEVYKLGFGVDLEIIAVKNDSITINAINNSSVVFKIKSKTKSILFLGDMGVEGGKSILKTVSKDKLKADYVQMAHHGQGGVNLDFYKTVDASYALWPTPQWLWENSAQGQGPGTGKYQTPEVRAWTVNELNIKINYVAGLEGNIQID